MLISEVSKKYDLTIDTIRYYERIGLIPRVNRKKNGIRDFDETDCNWVNFIKCMRHAGLSIESLIDYVAMFEKGDSTIEARKNLLSEQREALAARISEMQGTLDRLDAKIERYEIGLLKKEADLTK